MEASTSVGGSHKAQWTMQQQILYLGMLLPFFNTLQTRSMML